MYFLVTYQARSFEMVVVFTGIMLLWHRVAKNFLHRPRFNELRETFVERRAISFIVAYLREEPHVPNFMSKERIVGWRVPAVESKHGIFHSILRIGYNYFWLRVSAEILRVNLN